MRLLAACSDMINSCFCRFVEAGVFWFTMGGKAYAQQISWVFLSPNLCVVHDAMERYCLSLGVQQA